MIANKIADPPGFRPGLDWCPNSLPQVRFLQTNAFEALYGGAKGGGKTEALVLGALRYIQHPQYNGLILRRTFKELEGADGPIDRSKRWYRTYGGQYNRSRYVWEFPSGAKIFFGYLDNISDVEQYQGWQVQYLAFDQLEQFKLEMYLHMLSIPRAAKETGLTPIVRASANPGGIGGVWVKRRFINTDIVNRVRYFTMVNGEDTRVDKTHPDAKGRIFVPALPTDNPNLDPNYISQLKQQDPIRQQWFLYGNWDADYQDGIYPNWSTDNISYEADYLPGYPVYWLVDDGYDPSPRVILLAQQRPCRGKPDRLCIFAEYEQTRQLAAESIRDVLEWSYPSPELVYYDAAAAEFAANCQAKGLFTIASEKDTARGLQVVRRLICDHNGERIIQVHPRCKRTIEAIPSYRYSETRKLPNGEPAPEHDAQSHINDALRYGALSLYYYIETV